MIRFRLCDLMPNYPTPRHSDASDVAAMQRRLLEASDKLARMADDVARARTVQEYDGECRKRALALFVREFLTSGDSASAADTKGRASLGYGEELERLRAGYEAAAAVIARHDAVMAEWKTAQSVLSSLKATISNI